jgi:hypothetical protein
MDSRTRVGKVRRLLLHNDKDKHEWNTGVPESLHLAFGIPLGGVCVSSTTFLPFVLKVPNQFQLTPPWDASSVTGSNYQKKKNSLKMKTLLHFYNMA